MAPTRHGARTRRPARRRSALRFLSLATALGSLAACGRGGAKPSDRSLDRDIDSANRLAREAATPADTLDAAVGISCPPAEPVRSASAADRAAGAATLRVALEAELVGDVARARDLLEESLARDPGSALARYHLARAHELLGERDAAAAAYCRYLSIAAPSAATADASRRLAALEASGAHPSPPLPASARIASAATSLVAPVIAHHAPPRARDAVRQRVRRAPSRTTDAGEAPISTPSIARAPVDGAARAADGSLAAPAPPTRASTPASDSLPAPRTADATPVAKRPAATTPRSGGVVRGAVIGAASGAVIGGIARRSTRGAIIGAVAGGVLGAVIAGHR